MTGAPKQFAIDFCLYVRSDENKSRHWTEIWHQVLFLCCDGVSNDCRLSKNYLGLGSMVYGIANLLVLGVPVLNVPPPQKYIIDIASSPEWI